MNEIAGYKKYYINDLSLRGQFESKDDFINYIGNSFIKILEHIKDEDVILKKDDLWFSNVTNDIKLHQLLVKTRDTRVIKLKKQLQKILFNEPYWNQIICNTKLHIIEYKFDLQHRDNFIDDNCFKRALLDEAPIISFKCEDYLEKELKIEIEDDGKSFESVLLNIIDEKFWDTCSIPIIEKKFFDKYIVEVRASEPTYHCPHFHVISKMYQASYKIIDGSVIICSGKTKDDRLIKRWYEDNIDWLNKACDKFHER